MKKHKNINKKDKIFSEKYKKNEFWVFMKGLMSLKNDKKFWRVCMI